MNQGKGSCQITGIGGSVPPERERYISSQGSKLENAISGLEDAFQCLHDRLQQVRSDEELKPSEPQQKEIGLPCPLAENLRIQTTRIRHVVERIQYEMSVLEI